MKSRLCFARAKAQSTLFSIISFVQIFYNIKPMQGISKQSSQVQKYLLNMKRSHRPSRRMERTQKRQAKAYLSEQEEEAPNDEEGWLAIKSTLERLSHRSYISAKKELSFQVVNQETSQQCTKRQLTGNASILQSHCEKLLQKGFPENEAKSTARDSKASESPTDSAYSIPINSQTDTPISNLPSTQARNQDHQIEYLFLELQKLLSCRSEVTLKRGHFIPYKRKSIKGEYAVKERLGEGAFGAVYRCIHLDSKTVRSVKILKKGSLVKMREVIKRKLELLRLLDHPNVIKMYEAFEHDQTLYLILQYCRGGSIRDYVNKQNNPLTPALRKEILRQMFTGVNYLHEMGVLHRDIKPQNILLVKKIDERSHLDQVRVKIIDFGLSIQCKDKYFKDWRSVGSPMYMAPEVFKGLYSPKCDSWSCGIVMHMLLLGYNPFSIEDTAQIMKKVSSYQFQKSPRWNLLKQEQKQLLLLLTHRNYMVRNELGEILRHPYFASDRYVLLQRQKAKILKTLSAFRRRGNILDEILRYFFIFTACGPDWSSKFSKWFLALDADSNGLISVEDFQVCYPQLDRGDIDLIFSRIDLNASKMIDFGEFVFAMAEKKDIFSVQNIKLAFMAINRSKNESILKQELFQFLSQFGSISLEAFEQLLVEMDVQKTGKITLQQFTWYVLSKVYFTLQ